MKRFINYNYVMYSSITFFFITLIIISLSLKTGHPEIYDFVNNYSYALSERTIILKNIFNQKDNSLFIDNFNNSKEIRNLSEKTNSFVTIECENFDNSDDTYGFLNIYSGSYKFTYPFKKIDIVPLNNNYTFSVKNNVRNKTKGNIFLNSGGSLYLSALKKISIPSDDTLHYSLHYSDISSFTEEYRFEKGKSYFFSGIDDFGIFTIDYAGVNSHKFASKFRIIDFNHHTVENINIDLSTLMIKWKANEKAVSTVDKIVSEKVSDYKYEEYDLDNLEKLIPRATVVHENPVTVFSHIRDLNISGIFLFENIDFEESPVDINFNGSCTIASIKSLRISRNINISKNNTILNIMNFSDVEDSFYIKASKLSSFFFSNKTPVFSKKTELIGNLNINDFDKEKIISSLKITPSENTTQKNTILTLSPVINYFAGDF